MTSNTVLMINSMHLSKISNGSIVMHTKGVNGTAKVAPHSEYFDDLTQIMKGANNYKVIHPESSDYKYVQGIFCKVKWDMSMGYWRNSKTNTTTKMHVIILSKTLCGSIPVGNLYLSSNRVIIDYITCSKCLEQYCRVVNKNYNKSKAAKILGERPKLRLGI